MGQGEREKGNETHAPFPFFLATFCFRPLPFALSP